MVVNQLILKIKISEKIRIAKLRKKGENLQKRLIVWFKLQLWMWLVNLKYNFECDWLTELSDNKLPYNNLASELV